MTRLEQIKNAVTANGMREWTDERVEQAMREFATSVADDALKRAAERASVWVETPINGTEFDILEKDLGNEQVETVTVFKYSILSTPIDLEL